MLRKQTHSKQKKEKTPKLTSDEHHQYSKYLFGIRVGRNVAKTHAGETAEGEVECGDILGLHMRPKN